MPPADLAARARKMLASHNPRNTASHVPQEAAALMGNMAGRLEQLEAVNNNIGLMAEDHCKRADAITEDLRKERAALTAMTARAERFRTALAAVLWIAGTQHPWPEVVAAWRADSGDAFAQTCLTDAERLAALFTDAALKEKNDAG